MPDLSLRPMMQEEYDAWRAQSVRDYAADIAKSRDLDLEAAMAQSAGEFAQLLPDGLASTDMHLWTAVVDDQAVGMGWIELRQRASGVSAWIYDISLDADHRGRGLGRELLDALHAAARDLGATSMALNVFGDNTAAIRLYEASGYAVTAQQMRREL
ncbi:GNAT family N-acetyltransferase [Nocardioides sp. zg-1230]|uniref:GNAT family N-acetyltransferase n=1 Tax=Nocardioides sp. zg-1230 TaxID=2736601 RepID=UPI0015528035|nr:GNAT family N-acetyltransferase [Nocardioides sp. zg-1230]NPC44695.1 GNAT family N-acetyltransferase [Nocardioides sp. zg-1230]